MPNFSDITLSRHNTPFKSGNVNVLERIVVTTVSSIEQTLLWLPCAEPGQDGHYEKFNDFNEYRVPDQRHHLSLVAQQENNTQGECSALGALI